MDVKLETFKDVKKLKSIEINISLYVTNGGCEDDGWYILSKDLLDGKFEKSKYFKAGDEFPDGEWIRVGLYLITSKLRTRPFKFE